MFSYVFKKSLEKSPIFAPDNAKQTSNSHSNTSRNGDVLFRLVSSPKFLTIEYMGKSYSGPLCDIKVEVFSEGEDKSSRSVMKNEFKYEFSRFSSWFSLPVEHSIGKVEISISICNEQSSPPFSGLSNFGATCYANTFIQSTYFLDLFKDVLYSSSGYHSLLLQRLFYRMDFLNSLIRSPYEIPGGCSSSNSLFSDQEMHLFDTLSCFIRNLSYTTSVHEHHDIHEFSKYIFDVLESDNKKMTDLIEGEFSTVFACNCGCSFEKSDTFQDLQLSMGNDRYKLSFIDDSMRAMCSEEVIDEYRCDKHGIVSARKCTRLKKIPAALFLLINRFEIDYNTFVTSKNNSYYEFPEELDLSKYSDGESVKYYLYGVMVHSGMSNEGHYYCYLKINGKYYKFNDNSVYEASSEEAVRWNYGGQHPYNNSERQFSAYYLIYTSNPKGSDGNLELWKGRGEEWRRAMDSVRQNITFKSLSNHSIRGYNGPGRFNISDPSYPLVSPDIQTCKELDNVKKIILEEKSIYKVGVDNSFAKVKDEAVKDGCVYFVANEGPGRLVFIKVFKSGLWCTYPRNLMALGSFRVQKFSDILAFGLSDKARVWRERLQGRPFVEEISEIEQIADGDVIILCEEGFEELESFFEDLSGHRIVNAAINGAAFPIFVLRSATIGDLESSFQRYFGSNSCKITDATDRGESMNNIIDKDGKVECTIGKDCILYLGVEDGCIDINLIDHIHVFLLPRSSSVGELLRRFRLYTAYCMKRLQTEKHLQVVESVKDSINVRVLSQEEVVEPSNNFFVVQRAIKKPIKISFFTGSYRPINYPFMIENPGTIKSLRERYFFVNKIVRFDGEGYHECQLDEVIDLKCHEALLIEKK